MDDKYFKLQNIIIDTFDLDAPVEIEKGALWLDRFSKQVILQLKMNVLGVSTSQLSSVTVNIDCMDDASEIITTISPHSYTFRDVFLLQSDSFGDNIPIQLDQRVRRVKVRVQRVVFSDSTAWNSIGGGITPPKQELITSLQPELVEQFQRDNRPVSPALKEIYRYIPKQLEGYWFCTCGRPNQNDSNDCSRCGLSKEKVFLVTEESLQIKLNQYKAQILLEEEKARLLAIDKAQKEEERKERLRKEEKIHSKRRRTLLVLTSLVGLLIAVFLFAILPAIKYSQASNYLANKNFNYAIYVFDSLGNYKNSKEMVSEANYQKAIDFLTNKNFDDAIKTFSYIVTYRDSSSMINEVNYHKAISALENKEFELAAQIFLSLGDYQDSSAMIVETDYQKATDLLANNNFDDAFNLFSSLGDYRDSRLMAKESKYQKANELFAQSEYDAARKIFVELENYASSADLVKEIDYLHANELLSSNQFEEAVIILEKITGYKDSDGLLQEANYQIAIGLFSDKQFSESLSLFAELGDYKESNSYTEDINEELDRRKDQIAKIRNIQLIETIYQSPGDPDLRWTPDDEKIIIHMSYGIGYDMINIIKDNSKITLTTNESVQAIYPRISPDGERFAISPKGVLEIWDIALRKVINNKISVSEDWIEDWSPDGTMIATNNSDYKLSLWSLSTNSLVLQIPGYYLDFSPDGKILAVLNNGTIELWDIVSKTNIQLGNGFDYCWSLRGNFSPDGNNFACSRDNYLKIWNVKNGTLIHNFSFRSKRIKGFSWSPDSTKIATLSDEGLVVWSLAMDSAVMQKTELPLASILMEFSPDGLAIATSSNATVEITFWDVETGERIKVIPGDGYIGWSPSGSKFALKIANETFTQKRIEVWELP